MTAGTADTTGVVLTGINLKESFKGSEKKPEDHHERIAPKREPPESGDSKTCNPGSKTAKTTMLNPIFNPPSTEHITSEASSTADTNVKDGISCKINGKCLVSFGLLVIYVAFFGFSLTYSFWYVFRDDTCDKYSKMCNMQFIGCLLIVASLIVFSANFITHLTNFKWPTIQRHYIRIQFMVPVLAAQSWVLMFTEPEIFISYSFIAESYKTFSLYCVLHLFMNYLWERCRGHDLLRDNIPLPHLFGLSKVGVSPVKTIREFYVVSIVGALQCMIIRPVTYVIVVVFSVLYSDNTIIFYAAKGISVIQWVSQVYAIYAVLMWVRNFRDHYQVLNPLVKHFGLMLFHILIPTLLPQVMDICIRFGLFELNDIFNGRDSQNLPYKVQGFVQAVSGFLGTIYLTWMYSSRDVKLFSDEGTSRKSVGEALSQMVTPHDLILDFRLMQCSCSKPIPEDRTGRYHHEPDGVVNASYVNHSVENVADVNEVEHEQDGGAAIFHVQVPEE